MGVKGRTDCRIVGLFFVYKVEMFDCDWFNWENTLWVDVSVVYCVYYLLFIISVFGFCVEDYG